jgi:hypothetical protein
MIHCKKKFRKNIVVVNPPNYLIFSVKLMKNSLFSIGIKQVCLIFKKFYWKFNISYLKILSNSEDSQLQAKNTGYSVKNWKFLNSVGQWLMRFS